MKSIIFKAVVSLAMLLSCSYSSAAIIHYENTNTNTFMYGSYEFDDVLNTFLNIDLKVNFKTLGGPTDIALDPVSGNTEAYTDGSRSDTYYFFRASAILFEAIPGTLVVSDFSRFEVVINGAAIEYISGLTDPDFRAELIHFSAKPGNVSTVPEPDVLSLLILSPIAFLGRRRK